DESGTERLHQQVALGGREATELDVRALAADRRHLGRRVSDEDGAVAVEVRLALVPVVGGLLAYPVRASHVLAEEGGARPHDVVLVPAHVLGQDVGFVDPVPRRRQREEERPRRPLEPEDDRLRIGSLDGLHGDILAFPGRGRAWWWGDDLVVGDLDIL